MFFQGDAMEIALKYGRTTQLLRLPAGAGPVAVLEPGRTAVAPEAALLQAALDAPIGIAPASRPRRSRPACRDPDGRSDASLSFRAAAAARA